MKGSVSAFSLSITIFSIATMVWVIEQQKPIPPEPEPIVEVVPEKVCDTTLDFILEGITKRSYTTESSPYGPMVVRVIYQDTFIEIFDSYVFIYKGRNGFLRSGAFRSDYSECTKDYIRDIVKG